MACCNLDSNQQSDLHRGWIHSYSLRNVSESLCPLLDKSESLGKMVGGDHTATITGKCSQYSKKHITRELSKQKITIHIFVCITFNVHSMYTHMYTSRKSYKEN